VPQYPHRKEDGDGDDGDCDDEPVVNEASVVGAVAIATGRPVVGRGGVVAGAHTVEVAEIKPAAGPIISKNLILCG